MVERSGDCIEQLERVDFIWVLPLVKYILSLTTSRSSTGSSSSLVNRQTIN